MRVSKKLYRLGYRYAYMPKKSRIEFYATKAQPIREDATIDFDDDAEFDVYHLESNEKFDLKKGVMNKICA